MEDLIEEVNRALRARGWSAQHASRQIGGSPEQGVPNSVGSNGETVLRLKGERAFEVDVWTFNRRCRLL